MSMNNCNICVETFNKSTRSKIMCNFCDYTTCKTCCETYILSVSQKAHCMNCKKEWNRNFLVNNFTQKFINNDYKKHQEKCLLEKEISLLPATQPIIEEIKQKNALKKEIQNVNEEIRRLKKQLINLHLRYNSAPRVEAKTFVRKCPNGECRGFLSTQWKCGLCEIWCCPDCHEIKGFTKECNHTCKQENLETAKLLAMDSKPCPKCGVIICKSEGCDQMWCTQCHTAFSWRSGRIETTIHNPHYYDWLRKNGNGHMDRNPLDIQCGREIDNEFIFHIVELKLCKDVEKKLLEITRQIMHTRIVYLPRFTQDNLLDNQSLRIKFLTNEISEDRFKFLLQKREKASAKKHEISNVLGMYVSCSTDIMYRLYNEYAQATNKKKITIQSFQKYEKEHLNLKNYANQCLTSIGNVYNSKKYNIDPRGNVI